MSLTKEDRLALNRESLKNPNVQAFLKAIAQAEGGDYDFKYGAIRGKKKDPWRFTNFSTHPGVGYDGKTTAAGMYQINEVTWKDHGARRMGLTDFTPETQDLIAVSILGKAVESIKAGDIDSGLEHASFQWAALPQGPGKPGRYKQPYIEYEKFKASYLSAGGTLQ